MYGRCISARTFSNGKNKKVVSISYTAKEEVKHYEKVLDLKRFYI
jgi:hypothetical protein